MSLRIAVISDVHGNAFALEAVLSDLQAASPDLILNLGDQVTGQADPKRAYDLQRGLDAVEVLGSAEPDLHMDNVLHHWLRAQLSPGALEHLMGLPQAATVAGGRVYLCHGAPGNPAGHVLWSWQHGPYLARSAQDLRELIQPLQAQVVLCGHTHREGLTMLDDTLIVNVGAVGNQIDGDPRARWVLLEEQQGRWGASFRRVTYNWQAASEWVRTFGPEPHDEAEYLITGQ
ncbi:metallophosphoesterase [Deinococcus sp. QL22]|uniref:metallophosphoesterase family protein n=1 Tax=Deinococcus sp. QL22 TaxID=2939437 RepID=UPI0020176944|nr:metallophosphoesterase family protein [Deinococcus sp. QL22]UQN06464.1 metallophosphatase family protein [Deinococcus sp. QL22]